MVDGRDRLIRRPPSGVVSEPSTGILKDLQSKHPRKINGPLKDFPILSPVVQFSIDVHTIGRFEFMNFESIAVSLEETKN